MRQFGLFGFGGEYKKYDAKVKIHTTILIVAPGAMAIPPSGWGAVETIISETIDEYLRAGFEVSLLNSTNNKHWRAARRFDYDVVLCHADTFIRRAYRSFPKTPIVGITHYGLAQFREAWHASYTRTVHNFKYLDRLVCLNPKIYEYFSEVLPYERLLLSPNGSSFQPRIGRVDQGKLICVGKVEARKRQFELFTFLRKYDIEIEFIGEIIDERVLHLIQTDSLASESFTGPRDRNWLRHNLANYRALILLSRGEADALVLYEAQLAGLPIIVSEEALGSQDEALPWVRILKDANWTLSDFNITTEHIPSPEDIAEYSKEQYAWKFRNHPLNLVLKSFGNGER
jgi:hypothetical protein